MDSSTDLSLYSPSLNRIQTRFWDKSNKKGRPKHTKKNRADICITQKMCTHSLVGVRTNAKSCFQAGSVFVHAEREVPVPLVH